VGWEVRVNKIANTILIFLVAALLFTAGVRIGQKITVADMSNLVDLQEEYISLLERKVKRLDGATQ